MGRPAPGRPPLVLPGRGGSEHLCGHKIARLAGTVRKTCPELRTAWYSGREELPEDFEATAFDYVKLGGWVEALGPLTASTTNQRLYRVGPDGTMEDITKLFRRKP